jgi:multidrug efflux system membrane fusion protein
VRISGAVASEFYLDQIVSAEVALNEMAAVEMPRSALIYDGARPYVFVVEKDRARRRDITLAGATDTAVYVATGVAAGESVVTDGVSGLVDGAAVRTGGS